jgi:hypothetical protein
MSFSLLTESNAKWSFRLYAGGVYIYSIYLPKSKHGTQNAWIGQDKMDGRSNGLLFQVIPDSYFIFIT